MNGGQPNWPDSFTSLVGHSLTGSVKGWSGRVSSTNPCAAGWCGLTKRNKHDFNSIISARLETIFTIDGPMCHLPNNPDEDIVFNKSQKESAMTSTQKQKTVSGGSVSGSLNALCLDCPLASPLPRS